MKEMKIKVDGIEIELTKEQIEKINKPKSVYERIKTFEDVLEDNNISELDFKNSCKGLEEDEVAYRQLKLIVKSLRGNWIPDYSNKSQYKYYPIFDLENGCGFSYSHFINWYSSPVGSRLCFPTEELSDYAGKTFQHIYKKFLI